jgi:hemerythrin superfamily protein
MNGWTMKEDLMAHEFLTALEKDHKAVKGLLSQLQDESEGTVKARQDLFLKLKQELLPHMKGEEKHFYPVLMKKKEGQELGLEALEEHHIAEIMLKELDALSKDATNWNAKVKVFAQILEHHIEEEEEEVFDSAEDLLDENELNQILSSFSKEKKTLQQIAFERGDNHG